MFSRIFNGRTARLAATSAAGLLIVGAVAGVATAATAATSSARHTSPGQASTTHASGETHPGFPWFAQRLKATTKPSIAGTGSLGETLTLTPAVWNETPDSVTYQWYSGGRPIATATGLTFVVTEAQAGRPIWVLETPAKTGYWAIPAKSNLIQVAELARFTERQDVIITGTTEIGSTLTVTPGIYEPAPSNVTYQWQRDGVNIDGAISSTYVIAPEDAGTQIRVIETVTLSGYKTKNEESNRLWVAPVVAP